MDHEERDRSNLVSCPLVSSLPLCLYSLLPASSLHLPFRDGSSDSHPSISAWCSLTNSGSTAGLPAVDSADKRPCRVLTPTMVMVLIVTNTCTVTTHFTPSVEVSSVHAWVRDDSYIHIVFTYSLWMFYWWI